jgi:enoyl-CoA hydratase/carnithine racemase
MSTDVAVDVNAGVAVITLNRPEHLNAYTAEMGALLSAAYRDCDNDDNVRAIVVTGAGRAFCAGADFSASSSPFDSPPDDSAFSATNVCIGGQQSDMRRVAVFSDHRFRVTDRLSDRGGDAGDGR